MVLVPIRSYISTFQNDVYDLIGAIRLIENGYIIACIGSCLVSIKFS
jgi:hypothetical protein